MFCIGSPVTLQRGFFMRVEVRCFLEQVRRRRIPDMPPSRGPVQIVGSNKLLASERDGFEELGGRREIRPSRQREPMAQSTGCCRHTRGACRLSAKNGYWHDEFDCPLYSERTGGGQCLGSAPIVIVIEQSKFN